MSHILKIIAFTKKYWKWYGTMGFFVVAQSVLSLAVPVLSKQIVDLVVAQISGHKIEVSRIYIFLAGIIVVDILVTFLTAFGQWIGDRLAVKLQTYLSKKFYEHVLSLHVGFFDNEITGQIANKMYRGIESIADFIQNMLNNFLPFFLTALITIILLSQYSLIIAILLTILFPIYIMISNSSSEKWQKHENKKNAIQDLSQGRVFESISGIRIVKAFAAELAELSEYIKNRGKIENITVTQTREWHWYDFLRRLFLNFILFAIYAYIVFQTFDGKYTLGEMTFLWQLVNQARFPLFAMSFILGQIQSASAGSLEFFKIIETKNEIVDADGARELQIDNNVIPAPQRSAGLTPAGILKQDNNHIDSGFRRNNKEVFIQFKNVYFSYDKMRDVLKNINFAVARGERFALVGESGQGKSTLVNLLLRYYEPQRGEIEIAGQNIEGVTQTSLRGKIAVVFQEALLFSGTIYENIIYGKPDATKDEIIAAARAANAHNFIEELPDKYESVVGERGVKLSGGQKQRISIARAILKNAPLIVLDEATSSLDSKSELEVQQGLESLLKNRTSIIIAHRLSTISSADNILVLEKGTVAQCGAPKELMKDEKGLYYRLINLQQKLLTATPEEREEELRKFDLVE
jgi:ATP-binding cassette subfamily B protein